MDQFSPFANRCVKNLFTFVGSANGVPFNHTYCNPCICVYDYFNIWMFFMGDSIWKWLGEKNHLFKMGFIDCCYLEEDLTSCSVYQEV